MEHFLLYLHGRHLKSLKIGPFWGGGAWGFGIRPVRRSPVPPNLFGWCAPSRPLDSDLPSPLTNGDGGVLMLLVASLRLHLGSVRTSVRSLRGSWLILYGPSISHSPFAAAAQASSNFCTRALASLHQQQAASSKRGGLLLPSCQLIAAVGFNNMGGAKW